MSLRIVLDASRRLPVGASAGDIGAVPPADPATVVATTWTVPRDGTSWVRATPAPPATGSGATGRRTVVVRLHAVPVPPAAPSGGGGPGSRPPAVEPIPFRSSPDATEPPLAA